MYRRTQSMKLKSLLLFAFSLLILSIVCGWDKQPIPHVNKGVLSIEKWDPSQDGNLTLNGEWAFYWESLEPSEIQSKKPSFIKVPKTWDYEDRYPTMGYGIYHLQIEGLHAGEKYGLKIPVQSSSYKVWVGNELLATVGHPGKSKEATKPAYQSNEILFIPQGETTDLYIAISNFHYRSGGLWDSPKLGKYEAVVNQSKRSIEFEAFVVGSLILSSIYHLVLFLHRRSEKILLLFSAICLGIGIRTLVVGERIIIDYLPDISWELIIKIEYLMFYVVVPLFSWYLYYLFNTEVSKRICEILSLISGVFVILVMCTPVVVYTKTLFIYQAFTILSILYAIGVLVLAIHRKRPAALVIAVCTGIYILTVMNDMLYVNGYIKSINMSSFGLVFFIFSQSYIIAKGVANAFNRAENYSFELAQLNQTLENKVQVRTKSLEESKEELEQLNRALTEMSYHDPLTRLANRRLFDDLYDKEWESSLNNQTFLSIMFMDIDHFKLYNDTYGHQQGDQALVLVASTLKECIQKFGGTVARIGGEEFIGLVTKHSPKEILQIAEECRAAVRQLQIPHKGSPIGGYVTISIGVTTVIPDDEISKRTLIKNADEALYIAKEGGRNQVIDASN
jgi:diguanylate cyclase (GGDEF)-like protein